MVKVQSTAYYAKSQYLKPFCHYSQSSNKMISSWFYHLCKHWWSVMVVGIHFFSLEMLKWKLKQDITTMWGGIGPLVSRWKRYLQDYTALKSMIYYECCEVYWLFIQSTKFITSWLIQYLTNRVKIFENISPIEQFTLMECICHLRFMRRVHQFKWRKEWIQTTSITITGLIRPDITDCDYP